MMEISVAVAKTFDLERAVCSHGFFMMPPNQWDPVSRTFSRPLRLAPSHSDSGSVLVSISQRQPQSLLLRLHTSQPLHQHHSVYIVAQVKRMLRFSEQDDRKAKDFQQLMMTMSNTNNQQCIGYCERVFRSPTLFEDMVKCILLCNCQLRTLSVRHIASLPNTEFLPLHRWPRALRMAAALCDLQSQPPNPTLLSTQQVNAPSQSPQTDTLIFTPQTPAAKDYKTYSRVSKVSTNLATKFEERKNAELGSISDFRMDTAGLRIDNLSPSLATDTHGGYTSEKCSTCEVSNRLHNADLCNPPDESGVQTHQTVESSAQKAVSNFPSPSELANLDENFLAKRCKLGYRAGRIVKLAKDIVEGRIPMRELEEVCDGGSLSRYDELLDQLKQIDGFGPFTSANVLMCMGFYHVIPTDSETVRHLKQVHAKHSTIRTVQRDVQEIYGKYAPFQFLAYWEEIWHFYEEKFGKLSEMCCSDYKLITATNMRSKGSLKRKKSRMS